MPRETNARPLWSPPRFAALAAVLMLATAVFWWSRSAPAAPETEAWDLPTDFLLAGSDDDQNSNRIHR